LNSEFLNYSNKYEHLARYNCGILQNSNQYKSGSVDNGHCTDYTMIVQPDVNGHVWHDVNGFSCAVYEMMNWCKSDGTAGDGWDEQAYGQWSKMGKSSKMRAQQACCVCGGGMTAESLPQPKTISDKIYEKFDNIVQNDLTKPKWASKIRKRCGKFENDIVNAMKPFSPQEDIELLSELCSLLDGDVTDPKCYKFIMIDRNGDGLCCESGDGSYKITWGGKGPILLIHFSSVALS
jgi:hypothetical protein